MVPVGGLKLGSGLRTVQIADVRPTPTTYVYRYFCGHMRPRASGAADAWPCL